jgi:hypothetical protein
MPCDKRERLRGIMLNKKLRRVGHHAVTAVVLGAIERLVGTLEHVGTGSSLRLA